jgi:hemoglobin
VKIWWLSFALVLLTGCVVAPHHSAPKDALYQSLGGEAGVARLTDAALGRIHSDLRINVFFEHTDLPDLRRLLIEQICTASGGPCTYTGRSMEEAHSGMNLSDADFTAFVEDLISAMNEVKLSEDAQKQVLGLFGPMKPQIVGQ